MPPGAVRILRIYFLVDAGAQYGQIAPILGDGYSTRLPEFKGNILDYTPRTVAGLVTLCLDRGDMDGSAGITIADLVYMVDFMFNSGLPPFPIDLGDVDCSGTVDIADLVYLVDWMFGGGPAPCGC